MNIAVGFSESLEMRVREGPLDSLELSKNISLTTEKEACFCSENGTREVNLKFYGFRQNKASGIAESYSSAIITFLRKFSILFSITSVPIYILTNSAQGFSFLHILTNTLFLRFFVLFCFDSSHLDRCEVISHVCIFALNFPDD